MTQSKKANGATIKSPVRKPNGLTGTFETLRHGLLGTSRGKFALIKDDRLVDTYASVEDALKAGFDSFGNVPFLVRQILEVDVPHNFTSLQIKV